MRHMVRHFGCVWRIGRGPRRSIRRSMRQKRGWLSRPVHHLSNISPCDAPPYASLAHLTPCTSARLRVRWARGDTWGASFVVACPPSDARGAPVRQGMRLGRPSMSFPRRSRRIRRAPWRIVRSIGAPTRGEGGALLPRAGAPMANASANGLWRSHPLASTCASLAVAFAKLDSPPSCTMRSGA